MEGVKSCGSLAEFFLKVKNGKQIYVQLNPECSRIANYFIEESQLRTDFKCAAVDQCQWLSAQGDERNNSEFQTFILCIACDRLFHVRCTGYDFSSISKEHLPWLCNVCKSNPMNSAAKAVVCKDKYLIPFKDRISEFCKPLVETVDINLLSHEELLRKYNELQTQFDSVAKTNENLHRSSQSNMPRPISSSTGIAYNTSRTLPSSITLTNTSQAATYTETVMQANYKSTQIDDELSRSREMGQIRFSNGGNNNRRTDEFASFRPRATSENVRNDSSSINDCLAGISDQVALLSLGEIRKSLPKIELFDGSPDKWLGFQRSIERTWQEGQYDDPMMRRLIRKALTGQALERVDGVIDLISPEQTMKYLKDSYGNANIVVEAAKLKLINAKLSRPLTHASCVEVTTYIASYMAACSYAGLVISDTTLASVIHNQLESYHQEAYYKYFYDKYPNAITRMERLDVQFDFLNHIAKTLPLGKFPKTEIKNNKTNAYQTLSINVDQSNESNDNFNSSSIFNEYKYQIRDEQTARYTGYNLEEVNKIMKQCKICDAQDHFTIECKQYRNMEIDERFSLARAKNLCLNCMIAYNHVAKDCDIKLGCGYRINKNSRCSAKHHISLHKRYKSNYKYNRNYHNESKTFDNESQQNQSQDSESSNDEIDPIEDPQPTEQPAQVQIIQRHHLTAPITYAINYPNISEEQMQRPYTISAIASQQRFKNKSSLRTVKMFRTNIYGKQNKALGYTVGDSAAEVTFVKRELIDDLGISGEPCTINVQWTDSIVKCIDARKVNLEISGIHENNERFVLEDCYAIDNLILPPRSLNVDQLKINFPYLANVEFESYENAIPSIIIGSRHAFMIEAIEPIIHDGYNKPVAITSKLGHTIYGGAIECFTEINKINEINVEVATTINGTSKNFKEVSKSCSISPLPSESMLNDALFAHKHYNENSDYKQLEISTVNSKAHGNTQILLAKDNNLSLKSMKFWLNSCISRIFSLFNQNFSCITKNIFLFLVFVTFLSASSYESIYCTTLSHHCMSVQVLNLHKLIQEDQLQYLRFATEFASFTGLDSNKTIGKPFQKLIFLIRDWGNPDEFEFGITGGNYFLKDVLKVQKDQKPELQSVRQSISKSYDQINCCLLPYPGNVVASAKNYDGSWSQMDPLFKTELQSFVEQVLLPKNLILKKINSMELTCSDYKTHIETYFKLFQSNDILHIQNVYDATIESSMNILIEKCINEYSARINSVKELADECRISAIHEQAKKVALDMFNKAKKMGTAEHHQKFSIKLEEQIRRIYNEWKDYQLSIIKKNREKLEAEKAKRRAEAEAKRAEEERIKAEEAERLAKAQAEQAERAKQEEIRKAEEALRAQKQAEAEARKAELEKQEKIQLAREAEIAKKHAEAQAEQARKDKEMAEEARRRAEEDKRRAEEEKRQAQEAAARAQRGEGLSNRDMAILGISSLGGPVGLALGGAVVGLKKLFR